MKWMGFVLITMLVLISGIVVAENSTTNDTTDYVGKSIDLRYENLVCNIDFTVGQIDVIREYTNDTNAEIIDTLLSDKDILLTDKDTLNTVYDEKNSTLFNNFVSGTLHQDFNETASDLKEFKDNYKIYVVEDDRTDFKNALTALKDEYVNCTNTKTVEMSNLMDQYYKHREGMWDQIIKSMNQRGLNTTEMNQTRTQLQNMLEQLQHTMNSGNQTQLREQLQTMKNENLQLWAKFHSGRLNSYLNRIEPAINQYGRSDEFNKIKAQLGQLENISDDKSNRNEAKQMLTTLKDSADDMRNMSKDMLKQRVEDKINNPQNNGNGRR
jgi:hypothetical protein